MKRKLSEMGTLELFNERARTRKAIQKSNSPYLRNDLTKHLKNIDNEIKSRRKTK